MNIMKKHKYFRAKEFKLKRAKQYKNITGKNYHGPIGQLSSRHPFDCGQPNCIMCHSDKVFGKKSDKELQFDLSYGEQTNELSETTTGRRIPN